MPPEELPPARGTLLVARPHQLDPNFKPTEVVLCDNPAPRGSLRFLLNRPSGKGLGEVLRGEHAFEGRGDRVFVGGPVGLDSLAILHGMGGVAGAMEVLPGVVLGGDVEDLGARIRAGSIPEEERRFMVGYAGWGEGQLAGEMAEGTWIVLPATAPRVFDRGDPATLWSRVLKSLGGEYRTWANAPADPEMN